MDDHTKLDLEAALKVIEDLLREQLKTSGRLPETIVTVGGTALAALRTPPVNPPRPRPCGLRSAGFRPEQATPSAPGPVPAYSARKRRA